MDNALLWERPGQGIVAGDAELQGPLLRRCLLIELL